MFVQAYAAAVAIVIVSVVLGRAICTACGGDQRWWAGPAVGLSALIVLAGAAIKLPGRAATAILICTLVLVVSAVFLLRRRLIPFEWRDLVVGGVSLAGASLPFVASGRVGLLGASLDNDTALHLLYAEALRSSRMARLWGAQNGYPLGPHSVVAMLGSAFDFPLDTVFTGLLIGVVPITALVAADVLAGQALWRRTVVGLICSLSYLVAAYYGQGAFKETIMAVLLLGFVMHLAQARTLWSARTPAARWRLMLPAGIIVAAAVYDYSLYGVAWFGVSITLWAIAETLRRPQDAMRWISRRALSVAAPWIVATAVLAVAVLLPISGQALSFVKAVGVSPASGGIKANNLGNLSGPLSPYEALGIWWSPDFRHVASNAFHAGELSALALGVFAFGLLWCVRQGDLLMPAAAVGCALIWWYSDRTQSPYVTAKGLVIASPLFIALGLRALLTPHEGQRSIRWPLLTLGAVYCGFAAYSSFQTLRTEPVQAPEAGDELAAFHRKTGDSAVLFLGADDFAPWQLRAAAVTTLSIPTVSVGGATTRPNKPFISGQPLDFDSVDHGDLDHFRYVIASDTPYASQVPANFRLIASARIYSLWERTRPTVARWVFEPSGAPGAVLNCRSPLGKNLRAASGQAAAMAAPRVLPGINLSPGQSVTLRLGLPRGEWELSVQVVSSAELNFSAQGRRWTLPPYLGRPGPFFAIGAVRGRGSSSPVALSVKARRPSFLSDRSVTAEVPLIAATRMPDSRRIIPLSRACGEYIDWYRLSGAH